MFFQDGNGAKWPIKFTVGLMEKLRDEHAIDFLDLENPGIVQMEMNETTFLAVLGVVLEKDLQAKGKTFDELKADMDPECYGRAKEAVRLALDFFYQQCGQEKFEMITAIRKALPELIREKAGDLLTISGTESGNAPDTSESTPDLSVGVN